MKDSRQLTGRLENFHDRFARDSTSNFTPYRGPAQGGERVLMNDLETYFVIPTHRLRDVGETIHEYDDHFWRNRHSPKMIAFDDSTPTNVEKYLLTWNKPRPDLTSFMLGHSRKRNLSLI
jgi:hypothetical protein